MPKTIVSPTAIAVLERVETVAVTKDDVGLNVEAVGCEEGESDEEAEGDAESDEAEGDAVVEIVGDTVVVGLLVCPSVRLSYK